MIYVGGKAKQAKKIRDIILSCCGDRYFYLEPFLGGGSVAEQLVPHFPKSVLSDTHEDLMCMWRALINGWEPPVYINREQYEQLAAAAPSALRGFAGFAGSYRSKWFGGWAGLDQSIDHIGNNSRSLRRKAQVFRDAGVTVRCVDYSWYSSTFVDNDFFTVVYCDPPYADTLSYRGTTHFSHRRFWRTMDQWAEAGAQVYVSEFSAPKHWECIYRFGRRIMMDYGSSVMKSDRLYTRSV